MLFLGLRNEAPSGVTCDRLITTKMAQVRHVELIGASVSARHQGVLSPGELFSKRLGVALKLRTYPGRSSDKIFAHTSLPLDYPANSLVVGVDTFFWDSVKKARCDLDIYRQRVNQIISNAHTTVLFQTPNHQLVRNRACQQVIHQALESECTGEKRCVLIRQSDADMKSSYYLADGVHLNAQGSEYLEALMCRRMQEVL